MRKIELFWSFRSLYSYLATPGALELLKTFDVDINLRPVFPLAVRDPDFFRPDNIKRAKYILLDWPRRAEMLGLPNHWPSPDPIVHKRLYGWISQMFRRARMVEYDAR